MRRLSGFFQGNYCFCVLAFAFCFGLSVARSPATAAEITPETQALFRAVRTGNMEAVQKSLLAGADVAWENASGLTPVDIAIDYSNFKIAHYLLIWRKNRQGDQRARGFYEPPRASPQLAPALVPQPVPTPVVTMEPASPPAKEPAVAEPASEPVAKTTPHTPPETPKTASVPMPTAGTPKEIGTVTEPQPAPGTFDRIAGFFSFSSEDAETPQETEQASVPEPEPEPEPTPVKTPVAEVEPASSAETPAAKTETGPGMFDRIAGFFSFPSEDAETPQETEQASVPEPEPEPEPKPVKTPVAEVEQVPSVETSTAETETGPGMFERMTGFFSFSSEDAETPQETEQASVPEPEPEPEPTPVKTPVVEVEQVPSVETSTAETETGLGMFDRIAGFFSFPFEDAETPQETEQASVPEPEPEPEPTPVKTPVAEVEQAPSVELAPSPSPEPPTITETAQAGPVAAAARAAAAQERRIDPVLGRSLRLGKPMDADSADICIEKGSRLFWFCIEPVDWPEEIAEAFQVRSILYRGAQAIVHYGDGGASQVHALFPVRYFDAITAYFTKRLGTPGKQFDNWAILPGEPNRKNRTVRWRGPGASVLEIRQIDDLRWSLLPDTKHGVVRIYGEDSTPVFRHVSWSDFTLARMLKVRR